MENVKPLLVILMAIFVFLMIIFSKLSQKSKRSEKEKNKFNFWDLMSCVSVFPFAIAFAWLLYEIF